MAKKLEHLRENYKHDTHRIEVFRLRSPKTG